MQTSASALTTAALPSPAKDGKAGKSGASAFMTLLNSLTGLAATKTRAETAVEPKTAGKAAAADAAKTPVARPAAAEDAPASDAAAADTETVLVQPDIRADTPPAPVIAKPVLPKAIARPLADSAVADPDAPVPAIAGKGVAVSGAEPVVPAPSKNEASPVPAGKPLAAAPKSAGDIPASPTEKLNLPASAPAAAGHVATPLVAGLTPAPKPMLAQSASDTAISATSKPGATPQPVAKPLAVAPDSLKDAPVRSLDKTGKPIPAAVTALATPSVVETAPAGKSPIVLTAFEMPGAAVSKTVSAPQTPASPLTVSPDGAKETLARPGDRLSKATLAPVTSTVTPSAPETAPALKSPMVLTAFDMSGAAPSKVSATPQTIAKPMSVAADGTAEAPARPAGKLAKSASATIANAVTPSTAEPVRPSKTQPASEFGGVSRSSAERTPDSAVRTPVSSKAKPVEVSDTAVPAKAPEASASATALAAASALLAASQPAATTAFAQAAPFETKAEAVSDAPSGKAKPARLASAAKRDASEAAGDTAPANRADGKSADPTPQQATKFVEAAAQAGAKIADAVNVTPSAHPATPDSAVSGAAVPPGTADIRIALSREAVPTSAAAAPMVAMRVHTRDGVTRSIEIRLDPPELGIVDVKLSTGRDGKLTATLSAENGDAFQMLKGESGGLEAALRDAGVDLGEEGLTFTLNDGSDGSAPRSKRSEAYAGASGRTEAAAETGIAQLTHGWRAGAIDISV